ncbi:MAG: putative DNA binding domain-containing protein [Elusimicrobiota bacterium]|nr:putative DNA binding domain-containing protein [Elusimicrobiota bacterium]
MTEKEIIDRLPELLSLPKETEWVEFKHNNYLPSDIGEYISALANSACLHKKDKAFLVFGVEDGTHKIVGTRFNPKTEKVGNEELENWLTHLLNPRIDFKIFILIFKGKSVVVFSIDPATNRPVRFSGISYVRIGSYKKKLSEHPEKEKKIWRNKPANDWSVAVCEGATINDLDPQAVTKARIAYAKRKKAPAEIENWDTITFLNKAKLAVEGKITRTTVLLLGNPESAHFLSPAVGQISWFLRDEKNNPRDFEHFGPPFILAVDAVLAKIRNLTVRFLPPRTLFPIETSQYDPIVIREALHNCIAHQDYEKNSRIQVVERPNEIIFDNAGNFIPGSVEAVIEQDAPPKLYRNPFLAQAMVNLGMIETEGGGIREMFKIQRGRFFPLPTFQLDKPDEVRVKIPGEIIDEKYTNLLISKTDLDLSTIMLLDRVQKKIKITKQGQLLLRLQKLIEGRSPNLYVSAQIAAITGGKVKYMKNRGLDKKFYQELILTFIKTNGVVTRTEIDELVLSKLPEILTDVQKRRKINNLLTEMSRKLKLIRNRGTDRSPKWMLNKA